MYWDIVEVRVAEPWPLSVRFADGLQGRVRFEPSFFEGVFTQLQDPERFSEVSIELGTLSWPGDLDLAPDALYAQVSKRGECVLTGSSAGVTA